MTQTTMKIDRDVLADLRELAKLAHRSPQKHLRVLLDREKAKLALVDNKLTADQQQRADIVRKVEASEALEGYAPLSEDGGYAYRLQQKWILGEITTDEQIALLKKHRGLK